MEAKAKAKAIVKVQALWRGYTIRKQHSIQEDELPEIQFGCDCGDWMCSSPTQHYTLAEQDRQYIEAQMIRFKSLYDGEILSCGCINTCKCGYS